MDVLGFEGRLFRPGDFRAEWLARGLKVGVVGWHGHVNFGDEVMLAVIARAIVKELGGAEIRLLVAKENLPRFEVPGIVWKRFLPFSGPIGSRLLRLGKIGRKALSLLQPLFGLSGHLLVFGGGSIFHSPGSIAWKLAIAQIHRFMFHGRTRIALGVSLNPASERAERLLLKFLNLMDEIVVRDLRSREVVLSIFSDSERTCRVEPDLACRFEWPSDKGSMDGAPRLGLFLRRMGNPALQEKLESVVMTALESLVRTKTVGVVEVYATCADNLFGDVDLSNRFASRARQAFPCQVVVFDGNPGTFADQISRLDIVISMRLHPLVAGQATGAKTIGLCDSAKIWEVLDLTPGEFSLFEISKLTVPDLIDAIAAKK